MAHCPSFTASGSCSLAPAHGRAGRPRVSPAVSSADLPGESAWATPHALSLRKLRPVLYAGRVRSWTQPLLSFIDRYRVRRAFDIDVDVSLGVNAPAEKEVESKECQQ